jgi:GT2 family glycosyltransferase
MTVGTRKKIVLLGMMSRHPVAGVVWQTAHYLVGFERLGFEVYYVEDHGSPLKMFMSAEDEYGAKGAASFIAGVMARFGLSNRWALHALYGDGSYWGLSDSQLIELYRSAALIINLHGATRPRPEHSATGRLVYLETDPVALQISLFHNDQETVDFLEQHCAFFTFGENYGRPDCRLPVTDQFAFRPTRQPVIPDFWAGSGEDVGGCWTTIGNWEQTFREVQYQGEVYHWSKHYEFLKFLDAPGRTGQTFELALGRYDGSVQRMLEQNGWRVRAASGLSDDIDSYRRYIAQSRGEFTVAKDQNVRMRSGWFSDRSATYLAAGRPVVTQETGFSNMLPTGAGLFGFSTLDEVAEAVERINADYNRHRQAARDVARDFFSYDVVLTRLLADLGVEVPRGRSAPAHVAEHGTNGVCPLAPRSPFAPDLKLTPTSRWPTRLPDATIRAVLDAPLPDSVTTALTPVASVVVVTHNQLAFTRLCLESLLANTDGPECEVIVVDNGSADGTPAYLRELAQRRPAVRAVCNTSNRGFASAMNLGLSLAAGEMLVLLNNDTIVPRGWLVGLLAHLKDLAIGLVGPVTNRTGNEAQIAVPYRTYAEFERFAASYCGAHRGAAFEIRMLAMYCVALRRDVYKEVGPLDERFEYGLFEDDDYSLRTRAAGYRILCAEDVFVHHFGQASIGDSSVVRDYGKLFHENRRRWEEKWFLEWQPYRRRSGQSYQELCDRVRQTVDAVVPLDATVVVVSKGDDDLLDLGGRRAWHFPRADSGGYAGHYPADSAEAIAHLENLKSSGGDFLLFPSTALWWLEHYGEFEHHLKSRYSVAAWREDTCMLFALREPTYQRPNGVNVPSRVIYASRLCGETSSVAPAGMDR